MNNIIDNINNNLVIIEINNNKKEYFYNRNTLYVDLIQFLNKLNEPLIKILNNSCRDKYEIINYERVKVILDNNNNRNINSIFNISNKYKSFLINTNIYVSNKNKSNVNSIKLHNSEDTNLLNQSKDIYNNSTNQNIENLKPSLDYTSLENRKSCINSNLCKKNNYKDYNKWIINNSNIPNYYKCNYELYQETSNNNFMFEGHRGLKGASVL